jgi:hypothetical protein
MTRSTVAPLAGATLLVAALTTLVTWPHASRLSSHLVDHHDAYFSIWRTAWIAHALKTDPARLFDTNIFYPSTGTLAYSDAMLLPGLLAAPFYWAHVPPVTIYNALLLIGFVGSGAAMFVLARHLTGSTGPALVAAAAFTMAPYRLEHIIHLELQWAMWIPLTWWALHRAIEQQSWRHGAVAGACFALQALSCVYYSVFLALTLILVVPILLVTAGRRSLRTVPPLLVALAVALALALPYVWMYVEAGQAVGLRGLNEVTRYSAHPTSYLSASGLSRLWGWTEKWGDSELRLFPGLSVIVLALIGVTSRQRRHAVLYALIALFAFELSLGVNGIGYGWLLDHVPALRGLRAIARCGIVTSCALSVLAGLGAQRLVERSRRLARWPMATIAVLLALMSVDLSARPIPMRDGSVTRASDVYRVIRAAGPGVVLELPMPQVNTLPGWDAYYLLWSLAHWYPLVNGYSGYYPSDYMQTLLRMESFPSEASMNRLRVHDVRYIIVHQAFMDEKRFSSLMLRLAVQKNLRPWGTYKDAVGKAVLFVMER